MTEHKFKTGQLVKHIKPKYDGYVFPIIYVRDNNVYYVLDAMSFFPGSSKCLEEDCQKYNIDLGYIGKKVIAYFNEEDLVLFKKKSCDICTFKKKYPKSILKL